MSELQFALQTLEPAIMTGIWIGVILGIFVAFAKIGYKLAPYIVVAGLVYYFVKAAQFVVAFQ
jgi:predicted ABC-type sugar transport system permease subunit